jgi:hypothetical protein
MQELVKRIDRIESTLAIQQLPVRYALAVDGRDIQAWVNLFVEDVNCGRYGTGRDALASFIEPAVANFYRSQHFICGHKIDFVDPDNATGTVYCRAEHEVGDHWVVMAILYFDTYERRGGEWFFVRRNERSWYSSPITETPHGPSYTNWPGQPDHPDAQLPHLFPQWRGFWDRMGHDIEDLRTRHPVR